MKNLKDKNIRIIISEKKDGPMKLLGDSSDYEILENRRMFFKKNGSALDNIVSAGLIHGSNVEIVNKKNRGKFIENTDGLVTVEKNIFLTVTVADCLPIFLWTEDENGIGVLHAGWRSIENGIIEKGIEKLQEISGCKSDEIFLKIGPSIGPCCFEVGNVVVKSFRKFTDSIEIRDGKKYIDLSKIVQKNALRQGLLQDKININCDCTSCLSEKYFSYRRDKPDKIRSMIVGIGISIK